MSRIRTPILSFSDNSNLSFLLGAFTVLTLLLSIPTNAQLTADFEADTLSFCPPYSVAFKDLTKGRITSRIWRFGQGSVSNNNNPTPSASYVNPGYFDVTLIVSDGTHTDSITKTSYVHAFQYPTADFTTVETPRGCVDLELNFRDNTTLGDAPLQSYQWNFGDGFRSNQNNPKHIYTAGGKYTVSYSVVDTNGCTSTERKLTYVDALGGPNASFGANNLPNSCQSPHSVGFNNTSTGAAPLTYQWDLGNGNNSTQQNPGSSYTTGAYDVSLIVTDKDGCKDTLKRPRFVTVGAAKAEFKSKADTFCISDTNTFYFTNLSIGANTYSWDFGDGGTSTSKNPSHQYTQKGTYTVTLTIGAGTSCTDKISHTVVVVQPEVSFSSNIDYWCNDTTIELAPSTDFPNEAKWASWGYMYKYYRQVRPYGPDSVRKSASGWHYDSLTVYYPQWGTCSASVIDKSIRIWRPQGQPTVSPLEGCAPLEVTFTENLTPTDSLTVGTWDLGNGITRNTRNTKFTYTQVGNYKSFYTVEHVKGCKYNYGPFDIAVGDKQTADFTVDTTVVCADSELKFKNLSFDTSKINSYSWLFDTIQGGSSSKKNPSYKFQDTGLKKISLVVAHNGCKDTMIKNNYINVMGPTGDFTFGKSCAKPYERTFEPKDWVDVHRFKYDFGDFFGVDSINDTTSYSYASRGEFDVKLTLYNDSSGCVFEKQTTMRIRDIDLVSTLDSQRACHPYAFMFNTDSSQDLSLVYVDAYGASKPLPYFSTFSVTSANKGAEIIRLRGQDVNGCFDTTYHWVKTYKPEAKIGFSDTIGCSPFTVTMSDSSKHDTTAVAWDWYLQGKGSFNTPQLQSTFVGPGQRQIIMEVEDVLGCKDMESRIITVNSPVPEISMDTTLCKDQLVQYDNAGHISTDQSFWSFGNSMSGQGKTVTNTYQTRGQKVVTLRAVDQYGCDSTVTQNVDVQEVFRPSVLSQPSDTNCYPAEIDFTIPSPHSNVKYRYWRFDSTEAFARQVGPTGFYTYDKPGVYGVDLVIETTYGCKDTFRFDSVLNVDGPYAEMLSKDTMCFENGLEIFLSNVEDVKEFRMDFGNGIIDTVPGSSSSITHTYLNPGLYPLYLLYVDSLEECIKSWADTVYIQKINAQITVNDTVGCPPFNLTGEAGKQNVDEYRWTINGVPISKKRTFEKLFYDSGVLNVALQPMNTNTGCSDKDSVSVLIHPKPPLNKIGDGVTCPTDTVMAIVSGALTYEWSPSKYLNTTTNDTVMLSPQEDIKYEVKGTNQFGCSNTITLSFQTVERPVVEPVSDTSLYVNQQITLDIPNNPAYRYSWTPSYYLSCSDCPNPVIEAEEDITYTVEVSDLYGCYTEEISFSIDVENDYAFIIPNAFTPNGDGLNDQFSFIAKGFKEMEKFAIYNRWGEEVYNYKDMNDAWDGTFRGEPWPMTSVLVYRGVFVRYDGEQIEVSGMVMVLR